MTRNHKAVRALKKLGYDPVKIRRALVELTDSSQAEMAESLGCTRQNVGHYIHGIRRNPVYQQKLARFFEVPPNLLFNDYRTPENTF